MKSENECITEIIVLTNGYCWEGPFIVSEDQKDKKLKILFLFSLYQNYLKYEGGVTI